LAESADPRSPQPVVQIELCPVGNPGNLPDPATAVPAVAESGVALLLSKLLNAQSGIEYGRVDYSYEIGKYDVTVTQNSASAYGTYDQNGNVSRGMTPLSASSKTEQNVVGGGAAVGVPGQSCLGPTVRR